jgi:glycosyltransferase involved in cell wall biosynthesis
MSSARFHFALKIYSLIQSRILDRLPPKLRQAGIQFFFKLGRAAFPRQLAPNPAPKGVLVAAAQPWVAPAMPEWLKVELRALGQIDSNLYSDEFSLGRYAYYSVPQDARLGKLWATLNTTVAGRKFTHVVVGPWLKQGGADLLTIRHLAVLAANASASVLFITTEPAESPWIGRIPDEVVHLDFGAACGNLADNDQVFLLCRLFIQIDADVIHLINSRAAWETIRCHGQAVSQRSAIFASLFCDDRSERDIPVGYARKFLPECYLHLRKVFCDNTVSARAWAQDLGVPPDLFRVLPSPAASLPARPYSCTPDSSRILWAGRLDRQKRPDLLAAIARECPDLSFDVYGVSVLGANATNELRRTKNVRLMGEFQSFATLPHHEYRTFLFTSGWEGLPNILLDAVSAGMPIVASNVGGVGDLLTSSAAALLSPDASASDYAAAIARMAERSTAESFARAASIRLSSGYTPEAFQEAVERTDGYLCRASQLAD